MLLAILAGVLLPACEESPRGAAEPGSPASDAGRLRAQGALDGVVGPASGLAGPGAEDWTRRDPPATEAVGEQAPSAARGAVTGGAPGEASEGSRVSASGDAVSDAGVVPAHGASVAGDGDPTLTATGSATSASDPPLLLALGEDGRSVAGRLVHADGRPAVDAVIEVLRPDGSQGRAPLALTDVRGEFELEGWGLDEPWRGAPVVVRARGVSAVFAWCRAGAPHTVSLPAVAPIVGQLLYEDGEPVSHADLTLVTDARPDLPGFEPTPDLRTDAEGYFRIDVPASTRSLELDVVHPLHRGRLEVAPEHWRDARPLVASVVRQAAVEVQVTALGPYAARRRRPKLVLVPLHVDDDTPRIVDPTRGRVTVEHLVGSFSVELDDGTGRVVLMEGWTPRPGFSELVLKAPPPRSWSQGDPWRLPLRLVTGDGEPFRPGVPWPSVELVDAAGLTWRVALDPETGAVDVVDRFQPPVSARLVQGELSWSLPALHPGDAGDFEVDPARVSAGTGRLLVDLSALPEGGSRARLEVELVPDPSLGVAGKASFVERWMIGGLTPGPWRLRLAGRGMQPVDEVVTVTAGRHVRVEARPGE